MSLWIKHHFFSICNDIDEKLFGKESNMAVNPDEFVALGVDLQGSVL